MPIRGLSSPLCAVILRFSGWWFSGKFQILRVCSVGLDMEICGCWLGVFRYVGLIDLGSSTMQGFLV